MTLTRSRPRIKRQGLMYELNATVVANGPGGAVAKPQGIVVFRRNNTLIRSVYPSRAASRCF